MTAAGRYTRGLRIRTKCVTIEQLVAWFHRFCDDSSIFIATQAPRPEGLDTAFSVDLADGEPALAGEGVVIATWTTRDNQFKAPGMQIGQLRNMTAASKRVFEQMLIARALTQDASTPLPPKQTWNEDSTEVGAPTFDDLAAGAAKAVAAGAAALASASNPIHAPAKDLAKPGAKHTLIGLPAIPLRVAAPKSDAAKPAVTIAIARTDAAPKLEPSARPSQRMGSFVVPSKIAPVGAKKGPVVITTLRPTPTATPTPTPSAAASKQPAMPVAAAPPAATKQPVMPAVAAAPPAASKQPVVPMAAASPAASKQPVVPMAAASPAASRRPAAPSSRATSPGAGIPSIAAATQTQPIASRSIRQAPPMAPVSSAPAREPVPLARGSSAPMRAEPPVETAPAQTSIPSVKGSSSVPVVDEPSVAAPVEPTGTRIPRAATTLGSGPVIARMPAVTYDADLDDVDDSSLAPETTDVDPEPMVALAKPVQPGPVTMGWDVPTESLKANPEPASGWEAPTEPLKVDALKSRQQVGAVTSGWDAQPEPPVASTHEPPRAIAAAAIDPVAADDLAVPVAAPVIARAKSEPTWDELAASSEMSRVTAPPIDEAKMAAELGASPTMVPMLAPVDASSDGDQAPPLPPAPDAPALATPAVESPKPRRRRGLRIAVAAVAFVGAAAAATAVVMFGPWAFVAAEPSAAPVPVAEVTPGLEETAPRVADQAPVTEPPVAEGAVEKPAEVVTEPAHAEPVAAEPTPVAAEPTPAVAEPAPPSEPVAVSPPTKIAKKPARVKRVVAKPAMTRPKIRAKKKKVAQCHELSCL